MLKKHMTPLSKGGALHKHAGKGSSSQSLSSGQMSNLTGGDPFQRSMQNYAKASPMPQGPSMGTAGPTPAPMPGGDNDEDDAGS